MDATRDYHTKWSQKDKHRITYMWNLNSDTNQSMKQKQRHREQAMLGGCQGYTGWVNNKVLLYSIEHYIQYHIVSHKGKEYIYHFVVQQ